METSTRKPLNFRQQIIDIMLFAVVFILFFARKIHEPDIWWQLETGKYIVQHNFSVPKTDVFSTTLIDAPWINIKWLFEVFMFKLYSWIGISGIYVLHFVLWSGILFFLLKTIRQIYSQSIPVFYLSVVFSFLALRLNFRPEVISYLFTSVMLYILWVHSDKKNNRLVWVIPLILLFWVNTHDAYPVGYVILGVYALFSKHFFTNKQNLWVLLGALIPLFINPYGLDIVPNSIRLFKDFGNNTFTTELLPVTDKNYWNIFSGLWAIVSAVVLFMFIKTKEYKNWPKWYLILLTGFLYLALKANRNIPFFVIAFTPVYIFYLQQLRALYIYAYAGTAAFLYLAAYPNERFGFGIDEKKVPEGVVQYIIDKNISGEAFSDYINAGYYLYRLREKNGFKTFIDLRDLEVFPVELFDKTNMMYQNPTVQANTGQNLWDAMDNNEFHFDYVILENRNIYYPLIRYLFTHSGYCLVYADNISSLFVKQKSFPKLCAEESFKAIQKGIFKNYPPLPIQEFHQTKQFYFSNILLYNN